MNESETLLRISLRQILGRLDSEEDRVMVGLYFQLDEPTDYAGAWPPTYASVASYIGTKFGKGPLAESTIRYRMRIILSKWRETVDLRD